jgi:hypothetical protein
MFYYIIDSIKIGKTKHFKNSSIITLSSKNSRAKKKLKINDIDLYYRIEEFNTEHNLNSTVIKFLNPKSFHMTKYVEQILVTNFLFKKYDMIVISDGDIKDFNKEKIKYFKQVIIQKYIKDKKYYFIYDNNYKLIKE